MKRNMQTKKVASAWILIGIAPLLLALWGCGSTPPPKRAAAKIASDVKIEAVQLQTIPNEVAAPGTVASIRTAQVAARVMGTVDQVLVHEGDRVHRGQVLVVLDDRQFAAQREAAQAGLQQAVAAEQAARRGVAAAEAQASVAGKTYKRYVYLREQKSVSPQEFDEVEAKQQAAQAMLAQARDRLRQAEAARQQARQEVSAATTVSGYTRLVAPFDGVVLQRFVDPGAMATPGAPLLSVEETSLYRLVVTIGAENTRDIHIGTPVRVQLDAFPGKSFAGRVAEIEPGANPASHTVQVKIDLPHDPSLRSGLFGRAWFRQGERQALLVPDSAILDRGQLRGLYVVDAAGTIHLRLVTLGKHVDGGRIVLSGLDPGNRVVTNPGARDLDGERVEAGR
jgi:RND family efflux transporter MFP subunit